MLATVRLRTHRPKNPVQHLWQWQYPCVAAHSTTRALYAGYNGALYQVKRASGGATEKSAS